VDGYWWQLITNSLGNTCLRKAETSKSMAWLPEPALVNFLSVNTTLVVNRKERINILNKASF